MENKKLTILVASMTGNALIAAEEIQSFCEEKDINAKIEELDNASINVITDNKDPIVMCSSTYGQGDVPDSAHRFYNELKESAPDLSHVKYALFGLGDMTYRDTFAFGGKKFDELFSSLKAIRIDEPYFHDASDGSLPEEKAVEWFEEKIYKLL